MKLLRTIGFTTLLTFIFTLSVSVTPSFAQEQAVNFSDVEYDHPYDESVLYLKSQGIVTGYADGTFRPDQQITRAEFLKIVLETADKIDPNTEDKNCFDDTKDHWGEFYICLAKREGFIDGYDDGSFKPENPINFAEASKIIVNVMGLEQGDSDEDLWYAPYVASLDDADVIPPSIDAFDRKITRAEMSEMVWRVKEDPDYLESISYNGIERAALATATGGELVPFESCVDLTSYLEDNGIAGDLGGGFEEKSVGAMEDAVSAVPESAPAAPADAPGSGAGEYSSTNVQVSGVDEADIVKNDGRYIYIVKDNTVRVVDAYPPAGIKELDKVIFADVSFYPSDMYVDGDRLVVIGNGADDLRIQEENSSEKMSSYLWYPYGGSTTAVYIFDITDRANIELERKVVTEGNYGSSRKVDDTVYLVTNKYQYYYPMPLAEGPVARDLVPLYADIKGSNLKKADEPEDFAKVSVGCGDILYWPAGDSTEYLIVSAIPVTDTDAKVEEQVVMGSSGEIYASRTNLYVTEADYGDWWAPVVDEKTVIHKFALDPGNIEYRGKGEVPGHILDQFSMDEYRGNFRIATTVGSVWDSEDPSTNNVYVLDSDLNQIGEIENIAPGETIYSTRFMGGRAYMVTFKKVDPFFVIDLSDPKDPEILGKLKIPGYSDYLHPYDDNHIIGFGKEAIDASESEIAERDLDFAWYQGMKVAMFDVSDVENPKEMYKIVIGDRGTESPLLYDHKALLFDKEKGIMAFPVTVAEVSQQLKDSPDTPDDTYGDPVYQGAYVYDVSLENGFEFKGKVTHYSEDEVADKAGSYWWGTSDIQRILYIGNYLYTVSNSKVKANDFDDLGDVSEVELEESAVPYYGPLEY